MAHHLEAAGRVLQDLGHVLADLAQTLATAARASAGGRLVLLLAAWQMLGQLAARLLLGRCGRRWIIRLRGLGHVRARRCRLDLLELQLQLFNLALDALRRLAEGHPLQPRQLELQLLGFQRLGQQSGFGRNQPTLQLIDVVGKVCGAAHADAIRCFASIPRPSAAMCVEEFASRCLPATLTAAPASV